MKRGSFAAGFLTCLLVVGVTTTAYAAGIMAERSTHRVFVDGREVQMEAYRIKGNNYVKLRDIGEQVGFNVYWDSVNGCVQVESGKPYTGKAPAKAEPDKPESHPESTAPTNDADVDAVKVEILNTKQQRIQLSENPCSWTAHIVHHPHAGSCPASLGNGTDDTYYHFIRNHFPDRKYASYTAMDLLCHSCPLVCITGKTTDDRRSTAILCMERSMCTPVYGCDTNRYYL